MLEKIVNFRIGSALGVLVGIGLVIWVAPTKTSGQGLLFLAGFCATVLVVEIARLIKQALTRARPQKSE